MSAIPWKPWHVKTTVIELLPGTLVRLELIDLERYRLSNPRHFECFEAAPDRRFELLVFGRTEPCPDCGLEDGAVAGVTLMRYYRSREAALRRFSFAEKDLFELKYLIELEQEREARAEAWLKDAIEGRL